MNDKIREVALSVADEFGYSTNSAMRNNFLPAFLTRCLQELSKDVEPVAWRWRGYSQFKTGNPNDWRYKGGDEKPEVCLPECCDFEPLYLHPPLTEQDKLDAARYRWLATYWLDSSPANVIPSIHGAEDMEELEAAIDRAMENGK